MTALLAKTALRAKVQKAISPANVQKDLWVPRVVKKVRLMNEADEIE